MKINSIIIAVSMLLSMAAQANDSTQSAEAKTGFDSLNWRLGPRQEVLADKATIQLANSSLASLSEQDSTKFLELTHNLPDPGNYIIVSKEGNWWADFSFDPMGYVKDDEKIDADAILKSLKESDGPANERRAKMGIPALYIEDWYVTPHYDPATHLLEWGVKVRSEGHEGINYTVRILGREGVMNATLVTDPARLQQDMPKFKEMLTTFQFTSGHRYSEFKPGDHVAELGLGALIVGGAAAVATKKGFWGALGAMLAAGWKIVAAAIVAVGAWAKSLFGKKKQQ
jgi:uncharacterized membrane-anchored protein